MEIGYTGNFAEEITQRLQHLMAICAEEYPDQRPLNINSLADFVLFLNKYEILEYPGIVLTTEGNIRIRWKNSTDSLAIEFCGLQDTKYVLVSPSEDNVTKYLHGSITFFNLFSDDGPQNIQNWCRQR